MAEKTHLRILVEDYFSAEGSVREKLEALDSAGEEGIEEFLYALREDKPRSDLDAKSLFELTDIALDHFMQNSPDYMVEQMEKGNLHESYIYGLLGAVQTERARQKLLEGLRSNESYNRGNAARALIHHHHPDVIPDLIQALGDEDSSVQFTIVKAMLEDSFFRIEEAIPYLQDIISEKCNYEKHLGLWVRAKKVLHLINPTFEDIDPRYQALVEPTPMYYPPSPRRTVFFKLTLIPKWISKLLRETETKR